jgi:hypothetical protein
MPAPAGQADQPIAGSWQFKPEGPVAGSSMGIGSADHGSLPAPATPEVQWTASEFIAHHKGIVWYLLLVLGAAALSAILYFLTHDKVTVAVVLFVALLLGIAAGRKPRVLNYAVSIDGIDIGSRFYAYSQFRSFSMVNEGAFTSIMFMPLQRFMPPLSIYYDPADEAHIIEVISQHLPIEQERHDLMDQIVRRIRF